ncbi:MAG: ExeM/NucH family extracellular endonuclease [Opitutae bacterium]|nr:ExeM/NucH family extracellular endonuclease [Opitutae bacterium]
MAFRSFLQRLAGFLFCALMVPAMALAQISYTGGNYTQNFNTLPASGTFTLSGPGPIALDAAPISAAGLGGWSLAKNTGSGANALFFVGTGSSTTGGAYSFGAASASDRALGSLGSGSMASRFGMVLTNDTGAIISQFTLTYTGEQWRHGGAATPNKLTFSYSVGGASISSGTFTAAPTLDFTGLLTTPTGGALDGNALANSSLISATITGLAWAPGQTLVLRWTDVDDTGSDDGLAIDELTFTTPVGVGGAQPAVISTTPASSAVNVSPATNVVINFNLPVTVSGDWFALTGAASGPHAATVTGGPTSFTLTPAAPFAEGETVTLKVFAAQVTDAATGAKHPDADYTGTFNTFTANPLPIHTIQGSGTTSAYVGQQQTIVGIVTASFQAPGGLGGFYVQAAEADYDSDPATSEGMFVFNTSFPVSVGDVVKVTGTVAEFGTAPATQTELTSVLLVTHLGTAALPAPVAVALPFTAPSDAERYEGMRVTLPQTLTVTDNFDLGHFGEFILSNGRLSTPTNIVAPGAPAILQELSNSLNQILVDDATSATYPDPTPYLADSDSRGLTRRAGSTATGVSGILDEKFGSYIIEPTDPIAFTDANPRTDVPVIGGSLRVAIGNVLNFFNGDGHGGGFPTARGADTFAEYQRQRAKIVAGITSLAPDVMGLTEVENDGFGPDSAIADLVNGLNAAAPVGTAYAFVDASGVDNGTDLIHVAFIYRTENVALVGGPAALSNQYFAGIARPPLAQTFRQTATGETLTVCINHFRAKGSAASSAAATDGISPNPNLDTGDGQGTNKYVRTREAQTLVQWLATDPTGSGDPDFLIIGDLNAYAKEDPIAALEGASYNNLTEAAEGPGGYSYAFSAEFGHLDHALANPHLMAQVTDAATWHVNADEPVYYDYNVENKSAAQQTINTDVSYRYSDHDPVVIGLDLHPDYAAPAFTTQPAAQTVTVGDSVTFTAAASGYPAPTYQWLHNGAPIPGATSTALTLGNVTTANAGSYTVAATNSQGAATSDAANLTVNKAVATVTLGSLNQNFDGSPKSATATTAPGGLNVTFTYDGSAIAPTAPGSYAVIATVNDANYIGSASGTLVIRDVTPPVLHLPANLVLEATSPTGAVANYAATATDDADGSVPVTLSPASGTVFPLGTTTVTASATDAAGNTSTGSFTVTVQDTSAPVISSLTASPNVLWPANHKMVAVTLTATVSDASDSAPVTHIVSVASNEPVNGTGDGNTSADWQITGALTLNLRAERAGNAGDRIYTITVESRDRAGNASTRTVTVTVPHNK